MAELGGIMAQGREAASERQGQEQRGAPSTPEVAPVYAPFPAAQHPRSEGLPAAHIAALAVVGIALGGLALGALLLLRRRRSSRIASRVSSRPSAPAAAAKPADARCGSMASPKGAGPGPAGSTAAQTVTDGTALRARAAARWSRATPAAAFGFRASSVTVRPAPSRRAGLAGARARLLLDGCAVRSTRAANRGWPTPGRDCCRGFLSSPCAWGSPLRGTCAS